MEIWGHRGAYHFAPENTLTAFQIAADMGADGVEFDIQLTKDNEIVVIHDETVDRTSNGHGFVKDFTLAEIKKLNFNKRGITKPEFMEIPTLDEALTLLKITELKINIELKTGVVYYEGIERKALDTALKHGLCDRIVWSSFNHYSAEKIKLLDNNQETALLCGGGILTTASECERTRASALHVSVEQLLYPGLSEDCRKRGISLRVWTVNEPEEFELALKNKADGVFTNRIDVGKNYR